MMNGNKPLTFRPFGVTIRSENKERLINPNERLIMKMKLECQECDKVFSKSTKTVFPKCPRCKSEDLFPTTFFGRREEEGGGGKRRKREGEERRLINP